MKPPFEKQPTTLLKELVETDLSNLSDRARARFLELQEQIQRTMFGYVREEGLELFQKFSQDLIVIWY